MLMVYNSSDGMLGVIIHVGQTPKVCGGGRCPIFSDGKFKFVPCYFDPPREPLDPTFRQLGLAEYVRRELADKPAFKSPEFKTFTYSHIRRAEGGGTGVPPIYQRLGSEGGFLFFFSTLYYWDKASPQFDWISLNHGAYLIGYFKIEGVHSDEELGSSQQLQTRFKENGQLARRDPETGEEFGAHAWISGSEGSLFPRAVPMTDPSDPTKWNVHVRNNLTTVGGKPLSEALYNWTLICPPTNLDSFWSWIRKFTA